MTSRALEKQIAEFVALIEQHLARLIHTGHQRTMRLPKERRSVVLENALVVMWRTRNDFDPLTGSIVNWFQTCLTFAVTEMLVWNEEELLVLEALSPTPPIAEQATTSSSFEGVVSAAAAPGSDPAQKIGAECPMCWKCQYHQGWLPKRDPYPEGWVPKNEMDLICKAIDERKIEIAKYVQGRYDPALLED